MYDFIGIKLCGLAENGDTTCDIDLILNQLHPLFIFIAEIPIDFYYCFFFLFLHPISFGIYYQFYIRVYVWIWKLKHGWIYSENFFFIWNDVILLNNEKKNMKKFYYGWLLIYSIGNNILIK